MWFCMGNSVTVKLPYTNLYIEYEQRFKEGNADTITGAQQRVFVSMPLSLKLVFSYHSLGQPPLSSPI